MKSKSRPLTKSQNSLNLKEEKYEKNLKTLQQLSYILQSDQKSKQIQNLDYNKYYQIFTNDHSSKLYERHAAILSTIYKYYQQHPDSITNDLEKLATILLLARDKVLESGHEIQSVLVQVMEDIVCPYFINQIEERSKSKKKEIDHDQYILLLNLFGQMLSIDSLVPIILQTIFRVLKIDSRIRALLKEEPLPNINEFLFELFASSSLVENLIQYLSKNTKDQNKTGDFTETIIQILNVLSGYQKNLELFSQFQLQQILLNGVFKFSHVGFYLSIGLLNSLFQKSPKETVNQIFISENELLIYLLNNIKDFNQAKEREGEEGKEMRNDFYCFFMSLFSQMTDIDVQVFIESGWLTFWFEMITSEEDGDISFTFKSKADWEWKQILLSGLYELIQHQAVISQLLDLNLMDFCYSLLSHRLLFDTSDDSNEEKSFIVEMSKLETLALQILYTVLSSTKITLNEKWAEWLPVYFEFILNSFHSSVLKKQGYSPVSLLQSLLQFLNVFLSANNIKTEEWLKKTFTLLIRILNDQKLTFAIYNRTISILSETCRLGQQSKNLFGQLGGVDALLPFLQYNNQTQSEREKLIISAIDLIWSSVPSHPQNILFFIEADGIYKLLTLLENHLDRKPIIKHWMGCVLDILDQDSDLKDYFLAWRSDRLSSSNNKANQKEFGIGEILIEIWSSEEEVADEQPVSNEIPESRAVGEIYDNLRAKIYSLFCKLGFENFEDKLDATNLVKLRLIQKYLDFKIGQVFQEIQLELQKEGIRPISPDQSILETAENMTRKKLELVKYKQDKIEKREKEKGLGEEVAFYRIWMEGMKQRLADASDGKEKKQQRVHLALRQG